MAKLSNNHKKLIRRKIENRRKTRSFKPPVFPTRIVEDYSKAIIKEINQIDKLVKDILIPHLDKITTTKNERLDFELKDLAGVALVAELIRRIKSKFYGEILGEDSEPTQRLFSKSIRRTASKFMNAANEFGEKRFTDEFKRQTGTEPLTGHLNVDEFIKDATRKNVSLIKTIPQQYFNQIQTVVENAVDTGQLTRSVTAKLTEINDGAKKRARLIANDQIGKLVGVTNEARQRNVGVVEYIWRTMGDSRVRDFQNSSGYSDHRHLDGTIHRWDNPPVTVFRGKRAGERNHPKQDIKCRCEAQPVYDHITGIDHPETLKAREKTEKLNKKTA